MLRGCGAHATEAIGRWCSNADGVIAGVARQRVKHRAKHRVLGDPQRDGVLPARHRIERANGSRKDERERARPEPLGQASRIERHVRAPRVECIEIGKMHDERVIGGASFGGIDARESSRVVGASTEAVHSLGGQHREVTSRKRGSCNERIRDEVHRLIQPCQRRGTVTLKALVLTALVLDANRTR